MLCANVTGRGYRVYGGDVWKLPQETNIFTCGERFDNYSVCYEEL